MGYMEVISPFISIFLICTPILFVLFLLRSSWFKGIAGELMVHISAKISLNKYQYHILRNVTLPTDDGTTQIDHIIVSEYGVFVVETKNMKGWIFGGTHQGRWTQKIFKYTNNFQNPRHQNDKHVETLKSALGLNDQQIFSVIVFVGDNTFKTAMPENVIYGSGFIKYIKSKDQPVISEEDVQNILIQIEAGRWVPSSETNREHTNHVKTIVNKKRGNNCPQCGSLMVVREPKNGPKRGDNFLGCSRFPQCRETASISLDNGWGQNTEIQSAFTDSWENGLGRNDEAQSAFTDRAFH